MIGFATACLFSRLDSFLGLGAAVQEAVALVAGLHDVAVVSQSVQQGGRHLRVAEDAGPLSEVQVGRDHHTGALVQFGEQVEQQRTAGLTEGQVTHLVEDDEIHAQQTEGDTSGLALRLLLLQGVHQIHC